MSEDMRAVFQTEMEDTRRAFHLLAASLTMDQWNRPSDNPGWTIGQVMFHMTLAPRFVRADLFIMRRLRWMPRPPAAVFHTLNKHYTRLAARGLTPATVTDEYDRSHHLALEALVSVEPHEWKMGMSYPVRDPLLGRYVTVERLFHYIKLHFDHHAGEIRRALLR